jgi:hypothetical protein
VSRARAAPAPARNKEAPHITLRILVGMHGHVFCRMRIECRRPHTTSRCLSAAVPAGHSNLRTAAIAVRCGQWERRKEAMKLNSQWEWGTPALGLRGPEVVRCHGRGGWQVARAAAGPGPGPGPVLGPLPYQIAQRLPASLAVPQARCLCLRPAGGRDAMRCDAMRQ